MGKYYLPLHRTLETTHVELGTMLDYECRTPFEWLPKTSSGHKIGVPPREKGHLITGPSSIGQVGEDVGTVR
jgi:hypothetical protein